MLSFFDQRSMLFQDMYKEKAHKFEVPTNYLLVDRLCLKTDKQGRKWLPLGTNSEFTVLGHATCVTLIVS